MLFRRFLCLLVFSFACVAGKANAETDIEDFYGSYTGGGHVTDHSEPFSESRRDFALIIGPLPGGGFEVAWSTVKRKENDTDSAETELSEHAARFRPADKSGIFHDVERGIAFGPGPMTWARLKDDLLVVYRLQIDKHGVAEMHVYQRKLTEEGLELLFTATRDNVPTRTVRGSYTKQ